MTLPPSDAVVRSGAGWTLVASGSGNSGRADLVPSQQQRPIDVSLGYQTVLGIDLGLWVRGDIRHGHRKRRPVTCWVLRRHAGLTYLQKACGVRVSLGTGRIDSGSRRWGCRHGGMDAGREGGRERRPGDRSGREGAKQSR